MIMDVILVAIFLVAAIWGAYKGGIKIIASLASFILAFILAYVLAGTVGSYIKETDLGMAIEQAIETRILNSEDEHVETNEDVLIEDTDAITKIEQAIGDKVGEVVNDSKEALVSKIVEYVFVGMGFLLTFVGVKFVLFVAFLIVEFIFKLPVLKTFNRLTGCILELVLMLFKVWIVLGIISFVAPLDFMESLIKIINGSVVTKMLYEHNLVVSLIIEKII